MALNLSALQQIKPVNVPDPREGLMTLAAARSQMLGDQMKGLQIQQAQGEIQSNQLAAEQAQQVRAIVAKHGGDIEKAIPEINQINPTAGASMLKTFTDIKKLQSDIDKNDLVETSPGATLFSRIKGQGVFTAPKPQEPTKIGPGEGLVLPGQTTPVYTQPFAPKVDTSKTPFEVWLEQNPGKPVTDFLEASQKPRQAVPGVDVPYSPDVEAQRSRMQATRTASNRPVTSGDAGKIADYISGLNDLATLRTAIPEGSTGTLAKIGASLPNFVTDITGVGTEAKQKQAVIDRVKQVIGKTLEGGVLRKEDEVKYEKILPTIYDPPAVVKTKLDGLEKAIRQKKDIFVDSLQDAGYNVDNFKASGSGATSLDDALDAAFGKPKPGGKP